MHELVATIALVGIVIIVASLLSGALEKSGVPLVAAFLLLGAAIGPWGFGLLTLELDSPMLAALATLGLAVMLFSDAVTLNTREARKHRTLALTLLGPGTILPALLITAAARLLLGIPWPAAAILGAALASSDPVLLRGALRSKSLPAAPRIALRLETGMNDVILLPIVAFAILLMQPGDVSGGEVARRAAGMFLLGPLLGAAIGWIGITVLARVRTRTGVRRDYESLYALGLALGAFAAAEMAGGSGFLAAFAAGFVIAAQDVELCDCFLEYGEATAEMLLLLTFVALGTGPIWMGLEALEWSTLSFAIVALLARTLLLLPMLRLRALGLAPRDRLLIALFGPRGLASLLLTMLAVFAHVPGADRLFTVAALVVLMSVVLHGFGIALYMRAGVAVKEGVEGVGETHAPLPTSHAPERIDLLEVSRLRDTGEPVTIIDARADRNYDGASVQAQGAIRLHPDDPVRDAKKIGLTTRGTLVVYCA